MDFINKLGQTIQGSDTEMKSDRFITKDKETGETFIKLPMPDQETIKKVSEVVKPLLDLIQTTLRK
jgi:hypothetical protein